MFRAYLRLLRYPLAITAVSNVIAGYLLASGPQGVQFGTLSIACLASVLLYSAGMILNDVFDAPRDRARGRDRPIPKGEISRRAAAVLGILHLTAGVALAGFVSSETLLWAALTAALVVLYDGPGRNPPLLGVVLMGCARGANCMIGVGAGGGLMHAWNLEWVTREMNPPGEIWLLPIAMAIYTCCVTLESLREDHLGKERVPRLPFDMAYHVLPAAVLGSMMCDDHAPFAQIFWIVPALLGLSNGRAYAAKPSVIAARRTVRDGLLGIPCLDAVVVATVLATQSRWTGVICGTGVALFGIVAYLLMRLSTPRGRVPTADDSLDAEGSTPQAVRFHIEEQSTNHLAREDGTFVEGGNWRVLRCQIPAKAPTRFLVGIGEVDPEGPGLADVRIRPNDPSSARGLVEAFGQAIGLAAPENMGDSPAWIDLRARLIARDVNHEFVERGAGRASSSPEVGDWSYYEVKWTPPGGGLNLTFRLGVNEIVGVGEIVFSQPEQSLEAWNSLATTLCRQEATRKKP